MLTWFLTRFSAWFSLTWFLTQFAAWFSQWEPIGTFTCEKWIENWSQVFTWMKTSYENQFKFIHFIFLENRTSCLIEPRSDSRNLYIIYGFPPGLLLTWGCYYWLPLFFFSLGDAILLLLLFSCSFLVAITFLFTTITLLPLVLFFLLCYYRSMGATMTVLNWIINLI
jgi:hypothetical protein